VLERLAKDDPAKLAQIAYGLLPRDIFVKVEDQRALKCRVNIASCIV
jgi:hypothetical protein